MQALRKEPLTVYGDGKQTRSFQYVSDLVSILVSIQLFFHFLFFFPCCCIYYILFIYIYLNLKGGRSNAINGRRTCRTLQSWKPRWIHHAWTRPGIPLFHYMRIVLLICLGDKLTIIVLLYASPSSESGLILGILKIGPRFGNLCVLTGCPRNNWPECENRVQAKHRRRPTQKKTRYHKG